MAVLDASTKVRLNPLELRKAGAIIQNMQKEGYDSIKINVICLALVSATALHWNQRTVLFSFARPKTTCVLLMTFSTQQGLARLTLRCLNKCYLSWVKTFQRRRCLLCSICDSDICVVRLLHCLQRQTLIVVAC